MKIIHILHELKFSGAEIMYVDAAPVFQELGCELSVVATANNLGEYAPYFESAGYQVLHKPYPSLRNYFSRILYFIETVRYLKKNKIDVVHIHASATMWGMALCAWLAGKKSVYTFHNVFPTRFFTYPYHVLLRWSAKYIFKCIFQTISNSVYNHELNFYHNPTTKIYNWYGDTRYFPAEDGEKTIVRKELGIDPNALVIVSVGGCSYVKRHSDIIEAIPIILKENINCIYLHLGKGETEKEEIELANTLGISVHIRFCGNQTEVRKYLIASDIYLMPSRFEGIPITTIEAMACKIPAILYDVPGLCDFNSEGQNSILIPADYHLLAEQVIFLHNNPNACFQLTEHAKEFIDLNFSMKNNAEKIFRLYM